MEQKIKQPGGSIGWNIRRIRLERDIGQTELVRMIQLRNVNMTREALVKIERGIQHITVSQLRGLRDCLETSYDELLNAEGYQLRPSVSHKKHMADSARASSM